MLFIRFFLRILPGVSPQRGHTIQLVHGYLGGKKNPLPACTYNKIMTTMECAAEDEHFIGFEGTE